MKTPGARKTKLSNDPQRSQLSPSNRERIKGWTGDVESLDRFIATEELLLQSALEKMEIYRNQVHALKRSIQTAKAQRVNLS